MKLRRLDPFRLEVPVGFREGMRVPGIIYADDALMTGILRDRAVEQVANVATLPGIVKASLAMPDVHWGYGFPIGGVAAFDPAGGVVSPGGVGYDINCGVRLLRSGLTERDVAPKVKSLLSVIFNTVPAGLGAGGKPVSRSDLEKAAALGASWAVEQGFGVEEDVLHCEEEGCVEGGSLEHVSDRAVKRGLPQLGSLGSGNHFVEVQVVDRVYDEAAAGAYGLEEGQACAMVHTGSRGFGHQIASDYIKVMLGVQKKYGIGLPDRQLACAPAASPEAKRYLCAMAAAANFAWANRQLITDRVRRAFESTFGQGWRELGLSMVYDVAHNIAKYETLPVDGREKRLLVHRKGATRAYPAGHPDVPEAYRSVGQPVLIPGDMGRRSYVLAGMEGSMSETFGSSCHGAGRAMSRGEAKRTRRGEDVVKELAAKGIAVFAHSKRTVSEEMPQAYKDVTEVVKVVEGAGLARRVVGLRPLGVVKG